MSDAVIETVNLSKSFGDVRALEDINLTVGAGEVFGFLGPNGAGKSTLIRILFDIIRPTSGRASILGIDCQRNAVEARAQAGYLPGDLRLYDGLTAAQLIELFSSLRPERPDPAFVQELCRRLDVDLHRPVETLSRGNKQKIGLVLAMMHRPRLLVLDEPTTGLDPLIQEEVAGIVEELAASGVTVFFSSHVLSEVERMCTRVAFIRHGRLVAVEDIDKLKERSLHILEVTFAEPVPPGTWAIPGVRQLRNEGHAVHLEVRANLNAVLQAIAAHPVLDIRTEQPTLEEVFLAYYLDTPEPAVERPA